MILNKNFQILCLLTYSERSRLLKASSKEYLFNTLKRTRPAFCSFL